MNALEKKIQQKGTPLLGASCHFYDPVFLDIIAALGYDAAWIEMEHAQITLPQAADLCRIALGLGLVSMIRIPDARRESVLKAAECGPDIIDVPMANSPEVVRDLVFHARYAPEGGRGFFGSSRAVGYGLGNSIVEEQKRVNDELCLMAQIETKEAVEQAEEIASVPGLNVVFLGPGDMSTSLGVTGQTNHPLVQDALVRAIAAGKKHGRRIAMATPPGNVGFWSDRGVELFFCAGDVGCLRLAAGSVLDEYRRSLG